MLLGSALIGDQFIRYTVVFATSAYRDLGNFGAANIIVRMRVMIIFYRLFSYSVLI
jgi:hypothetical protein